MRIDLNADVGEGLPDDEAILACVTSANVACGAHAGDAATIARTIALAARHGVAVGAHPGYPDREGFGRHELGLTPAAIERLVAEQVAVLLAACEAADVPLAHVKAHGALYNRAARDPDVAAAVARGVAAVAPDAVLVVLAGSVAVAAARAAGLAVAEEAFADRAYEADGSLRSRALPGAVLDSPAAAAAQAVAIARGAIPLAEAGGGELVVRADTVCVHGDLPGAAARAVAVRAALIAAGVDLRAPDHLRTR